MRKRDITRLLKWFDRYNSDPTPKNLERLTASIENLRKYSPKEPSPDPRQVDIEDVIE
jgi:hypothetical protein